MFDLLNSGAANSGLTPGRHAVSAYVVSPGMGVTLERGGHRAESDGGAGFPALGLRKA